MMSSSDSDDAFIFIDAMLDHQTTSTIVLNDANGDDMTQLEMLDMLVSEAGAGCGVTGDELQR